MGNYLEIQKFRDSAQYRTPTRCEAALFDSIAQRAKQAAARSTVPANLIDTRGRPEKLLHTAAQVFQAEIDLIQGAHHELLLLGFAWDHDSTCAQRIVQALRALEQRVLQEQAPPVTVRLVLDRSVARAACPQLEAFIRELNPAALKAELAYHRSWLLGVQHAKSMVQDRRLALITGINHEHFFDGDAGWHDSGIVVSGPVVQSICADWQQARNAPRNLSVAHNAATFPDPPQAVDAYEATGLCRMLFLSRKPSMLPSLWPQDTPQRAGLRGCIAGAQRRLRILSPALNVPELKADLIDLLARNSQVVIKCLLGLNLDRWVQHNLRGGDNADTTHDLYAKLLAKQNGRQMASRLHIRWHSSDGASAAGEKEPGNSHAKCTGVDNVWLMTGSTNGDNQSRCSRELDLLIESSATVRAWKKETFSPRWRLGAPVQPDDLPPNQRGIHQDAYRFLTEGIPGTASAPRLGAAVGSTPHGSRAEPDSQG